MVTACGENAVQRGSPCDSEIQLVPVPGSGMLPGYSVIWHGAEERVCNEKVVGAELKKRLPVLVQLADTEVADASSPGVVVGSHSGVEVAKQVHVFCCRDVSDDAEQSVGA